VSPLNISSQVLELMPVAVYVCDLEGQILRYNTRTRKLWRCDPNERDRFRAAARVFMKDGTFVPHSSLLMVVALRDGMPFRDPEAYAFPPISSPMIVSALSGFSAHTIGGNPVSLMNSNEVAHSSRVFRKRLPCVVSVSVRQPPQRVSAREPRTEPIAPLQHR